MSTTTSTRPGGTRTTKALPRQTAPGSDAIDAAIDEACAELRLPMIREHFAEIADSALREGLSFKGFLLKCLNGERRQRVDARRIRLVRDAAFHRPKRLEEFDYTANPNVTAEVVNTLCDPAWVTAGKPLCLIGNSGTGKSHLLIGIGTAIAEHGLKVRYTTTSNLVNELAEAQAEKRLSRAIAKYGRYDLLCLDEFGYLSLDRTGAKLLFQIFTEREERKAMAVASNAPFSEWIKTFTDPRLCNAIIDRLTFKGFFIDTGTDSYRLKTTLQQANP